MLKNTLFCAVIIGLSLIQPLHGAGYGKISPEEVNFAGKSLDGWEVDGS